MYIQVYASSGGMKEYKGKDVTYSIEGNTFTVYPKKIDTVYRSFDGSSCSHRIPDDSEKHIYFNPAKVFIIKGE